MRLLHLADLHLGWGPPNLPGERQNERRRERDRLLEKAVDYALSPGGNIQVVLIVGDLFETYRPEDALVRQVTRELGRLTRAGVTVVTVPGNHDEMTYRDSVYRQYGEGWPGELVRDPMPALSVSQEVGGTGLHIYSLAYTGGLTRPAALGTFPRTRDPGLHIGAFHGSLDWAGPGDRSLPLSSSQLAPAGYHYIALGHYHRSSQRPVGRGTAVYPGAVEFKSFRDPGTGFFTVAEFTAGGVELENVPAEVRRHQARELDISSLAGQDQLRAACRKLADPGLMLQLTLTGTPQFSFDLEALGEGLQRDFFYLELVNSAYYFSGSFLDTLAQEPTVRGYFLRRMREKQEKAATPEEERLLQQALLKGLAALEGRERP